MTNAKPVLLAEARRFVSDLKQNKDMDAGWSGLIDSVQAEEKTAHDAGKSSDDIHKLIGQGFQGLDNFIADAGYATTAISVLSFLKSPLYQGWIGLTQPNDAAKAFVQKLLTDSDIAQAWQRLLSQISAGQAGSDQLNAFLKTRGFDCTFEQVNGAFQLMRDHNVTYWSGAYVTVQSVNGSPSEDGPIFTVSATGAASMGLLQINYAVIDDSANLRFDNGVLSWRATPTVPFSGSATFSTLTQKAASTGNYTGNLFSAELLYERDDVMTGRKAGDKLSVTGRLSTVSDQDPRTPPGAAEKNNGFPKWGTYLVNGLVILQMLASLGKKYPGFKEFLSDANDPDYAKTVDSAAGDLKNSTDLVGEMESPFTDPAALDGSSLLRYLEAKKEASYGDAEKRYSEELDQAEAGEHTFDGQAERDADPEGDGWGGDVDELGKAADLPLIEF